jgi:dipeptidyl aminopeptidase/acylaminoacyl peptidase
MLRKSKLRSLSRQGAQDPRVNKAESDQIVNGLKKRGIDVEYMVKENEATAFHNEENKFDFYEAMEKFLDKHLHPETAAASSASSTGSR